jgi:site-specific DNA-methyltransferase (adenine-specific)
MSKDDALSGPDSGEKAPVDEVAIVHTNGVLDPGIYDADTSSDGYYLNPRSDTSIPCVDCGGIVWMTAPITPCPHPGGSTAPRPYYEQDGITIYHGDALDVLPRLGEYDLIVTSPPYNLGTSPGGQFGHWKDGQKSGGHDKWKGGVGATGIDYEATDDALPPAVYHAWQQSTLAACWEAIHDEGAIYYNHRPRVQRDGLWTPLSLNPGLPLRQIITWDRASGHNRNMTAYCPTYEWIMVFAEQPWRLKDRAASGVGDVWRISPDSGNPHPAPFPVALPARAIEATGAEFVLDPFCGSGSTLVAALEAGVQAVGVDVSEAYCEMAAKRLVACGQGQMSMVLTGKPAPGRPE